MSVYTPQNTLAHGSRHAMVLLHVGSRLLADAFAGNGALLLRAGARIENAAMVSRLRQPDVNFGGSRSHAIPIDLSNEIAMGRAQALREMQTPGFCRRVRQAAALKKEAVKQTSSIFAAMESGKGVDVTAARKSVSSLISHVVSDRLALVSLAHLKDVDAYTCTHSVNVAILAIYLALNSGFADCVEEIGLGALLHDVGKVSIPETILQKPGPLDELERRMVMQHPEYGQGLVSATDGASAIVLACIGEHHMRAAGRSYPTAPESGAVSVFGKMTALADVYDALTTDRPYRTKMPHEDALQLVCEQFCDEADRELLQTFLLLLGSVPTEEASAFEEMCSIQDTAAEPLYVDKVRIDVRC